MQRGRSVEQLYADAFTAAQRGRTLAQDRPPRDDAQAEEAVTCFQEAIRILSRLALVESAAQRVRITEAVSELKQQVARLQEAPERCDKEEGEGGEEDVAEQDYQQADGSEEAEAAAVVVADEAPPPPSNPDAAQATNGATTNADEILGHAMEIHEAARAAEEAGQLEKCIELYLSAGDGYMAAYAALTFPTDASTREVVREQIEYVIEHVSALKAQRVNNVEGGEVPCLEPAPDAETLPQSTVVTSAVSWPSPPTTTLNEPVGMNASIATSTSTADSLNATEEPLGQVAMWPVAPVNEQDTGYNEMAWPSPPLTTSTRRHSNRGSHGVDAALETKMTVEVDDVAVWALPPNATIDVPTERGAVARPSVEILGQHAVMDHATDGSKDNAGNDGHGHGHGEDGGASPANYSPAELDVLRRSSLINGHLYVPWMDDLDVQEQSNSNSFATNSGNSMAQPRFMDPDGVLPLSSKQLRKGAMWMRPDERCELLGLPPPVLVVDGTVCPQVVKQDIVTDCSFVASLCIAAAYEQRFQKRLITNILFPVDPVTRFPAYNPTGKYVVKLWANGVPRRVVIDDLLPVNPVSRDLLCACTTNRHELWVSLIEKAYLKLCGGYDYPGGNSGIDLFALTGWIPERIALAEIGPASTSPVSWSPASSSASSIAAPAPAPSPVPVDAMRGEDRIWEQLKSAFHFGDCIITMTTGNITKEHARAIGLVPMHVYAVLNVYETSIFVEDEELEEEKREEMNEMEMDEMEEIEMELEREFGEELSGSDQVQAKRRRKRKRLRLLHVKNPWRKLSWKGPYSRHDTATWQDSSLGDELRAYEQQYYTNNSNNPGRSGAETTYSHMNGGDKNADDGTFWIDLDSVRTYFESLYLNWNPELFPHRSVFHEHWPLERGPLTDTVTLAYNPQYSLRFQRRGDPSNDHSSRDHGCSTGSTAVSMTSTVWVLLTRHVRTVEREADPSKQQFLTLHVYRDTDGQRVFYNQDALYRGTYSNNPHTLVSLDVDFAVDPEPSFTLVASQYEKLAPLDYTLSVFSTAPFVCRPVPHLDETPHAALVTSAWDVHSAGGRPYLATFMENPQYHLCVPRTVRRLSMLLEVVPGHPASDSDPAVDSVVDRIPVNLRAVHNSCERACGLPTSHVSSSGQYRPGFCVLELDLSQARDAREDERPQPQQDHHNLVVIPSTFHADTLTQFRLRVLCEPPVPLLACTSLPLEGEQLHSYYLDGRWDEAQGTAAGCARYGCYTFNPRILVHVPRTTSDLFARLVPVRNYSNNPSSSTASNGGATAVHGDTLPSVNVAIFASNADGELPLASHPQAAWRSATSHDGIYAGGNPSGVVTRRGVAFPPGCYVIVVSTYHPQECGFQLRLYSAGPVEVRGLAGVGAVTTTRSPLPAGL